MTMIQFSDTASSIIKQVYDPRKINHVKKYHMVTSNNDVDSHFSPSISHPQTPHDENVVQSPLLTKDHFDTTHSPLRLDLLNIEDKFESKVNLLHDYDVSSTTFKMISVKHHDIPIQYHENKHDDLELYIQIGDAYII